MVGRKAGGQERGSGHDPEEFPMVQKMEYYPKSTESQENQRLYDNSKIHARVPRRQRRLPTRTGK